MLHLQWAPLIHNTCLCSWKISSLYDDDAHLHSAQSVCTHRNVPILGLRILSLLPRAIFGLMPIFCQVLKSQRDLLHHHCNNLENYRTFISSKTVFFSFSSGKTSGNLIYFRVITRNSNNENEPKGNVIGHKLKNKRVCSEDFSLALHHLECHSIRCCYDRARDLCPKFFFYRFQVLPINRTKTWECSGATLKWGVK